MLRGLKGGLVVALMAVAGLGACGDNYATGTFTRIGVEVAGKAAENGFVDYFGLAIQQKVERQVVVGNMGTKTLKISSVEWAKGEDGALLKNKYVSLNWAGSVGADAFPYSIEPNTQQRLTFKVAFEGPLGKALDDFSDSVLIIKSNALDDLGRNKVPEFKIVFSMRQDLAYPRVTPTSYRFQNATFARPETQEFRIYNDQDMATQEFHIRSVRLENPSPTTGFTLKQTPSDGTVVLAPGDPGYQDVVFSVTYQPQGDQVVSNAILIETDVGAGVLRVPLETGTTRGSYSLSYSHVDDFDFTRVTTRETRSVLITSEGPGPITLKLPRIEPAEARADYTVTGWIPATTPGASDTEVTTWPRGLQVGKALRLEVTYQPTAGRDTANGQLLVGFEDPEPGEIAMDLWSGQPKSKLVVAPATDNVAVSGAVVSGATGTRKVVLYNEGNGPLQVSAARVVASFEADPKVWSLATTFNALTVAPGGLAVVELEYELAGIDTMSGVVSEALELTYFDDFTGQSETRQIALIASDTAGTNPTASLGDAGQFTGAVVGDALALSGAASTAASGALQAGSYIFYLTAKPAGSQARLNVQGGVRASFIPDLPGSYTVELVVFAQDGDDYLYSPPATMTITVAP